MARIKLLLKERLKGKIPKEKLEFLPSGFQRVGDIIILNLNQEASRYSKEIAGIILEKFKVRTVCSKFDGVKDELRKPSVRKLAGDGTKTIHKENGCLYKMDVTKVMFAKGNFTERGKLAGVVKPGETVVDMFAGIGYFSIPIAKRCRPEKIYAIDINPLAVKYLKENIRLNRVKNIEPVSGDCRDVHIQEKADRVIMGYFPGTEKFLHRAFEFLKPEGWIHYHNIYPEIELWEKPLSELKKASQDAGFSIVKTDKRIVKHYSPGVLHVVIDGLFRKST